MKRLRITLEVSFAAALASTALGGGFHDGHDHAAPRLGQTVDAATLARPPAPPRVCTISSGGTSSDRRAPR